MNPSPISTQFDAIIKPYGEMAERLNAAVLKTVERDERSGGSNPPLSAIHLFLIANNRIIVQQSPLLSRAGGGRGIRTRQGAERQENASVARF